MQYTAMDINRHKPTLMIGRYCVTFVWIAIIYSDVPIINHINAIMGYNDIILYLYS